MSFRSKTYGDDDGGGSIVGDWWWSLWLLSCRHEQLSEANRTGSCAIDEAIRLVHRLDNSLLKHKHISG